jgi:regulator of cell morphogenesis and NO signaling
MQKRRACEEPTMAVTMDMTVQEAVNGSEARARVMDKYGIDTCCGGKVSLRQVCERRGLDPEVLLRELAAADGPVAAGPTQNDLASLSLVALTDHLLDTHHVFLRERLPRLVELAQKVARVHGPNHPELIELCQVVLRFNQEMLAHLEKEEQVLFPFIRQLESDPAGLTMPPHFVSQPIRVMLMEHDSAASDLEQMRQLSGGYQFPEDACGSYRALFNGLAELDADTQAHMQKEGDLLFPKTNELAQAVGAGH